MTAARVLGWSVFSAIGPLIAWYPTSALTQSLLAQATFSTMFALGVGLLLRQNGMVSFGHAAFFGLPAYMLGALLPLNALPIELLVIAIILVIGVLAFMIGLVIVRTHGIAFGMLTLAIGQAVYEAATRLHGVTGGNDGLSLNLPPHFFGLSLKTLQQPPGMLTLSWLVMVAMLLLVSVFASSRFGILTEAIRDNEERARFLGYRTLMPRAAVFGLSAAVTAVGGVMFALYNAFISPETVHWSVSGSALIMAILGGSGVTWGPVAGAFAYFFLKESLDIYTTHWLSIIGVALIVITVAFPTGLAGLVPWARRLIGSYMPEGDRAGG